MHTNSVFLLQSFGASNEAFKQNYKVVLKQNSYRKAETTLLLILHYVCAHSAL